MLWIILFRTQHDAQIALAQESSSASRSELPDDCVEIVVVDAARLNAPVTDATNNEAADDLPTLHASNDLPGRSV